MKKKVTIYDVAEAADVSLATVSRVINGSNVVKPATRERVLETIKRLDFKPNQIARGLATSKTTTIAVVFPQSLFGHVKDMIGGIGDTGRTLDFNIIMYTTDELGLGNPIEEVIEKVKPDIVLVHGDMVLYYLTITALIKKLISLKNTVFLQLLLDIRFLMKISALYMLMQRVLHMI